MSAREPVPADEREVLIEARKAVTQVLNGSRGYPLDVQAAQIMLVIDQQGFRRQGPITDAEIDAAARSIANLLHADWADVDVWGGEWQQFRDAYYVKARAALEAARGATP